MSRKLIRTLVISVGLSLVGVLVVVLFMGNTGGLRQLGELEPLSLLVAAGLLLVHLTLGGLRLQALVGLTGDRAGVLASIRAFVMGMFGAALTPSGGGNAPGIAISFQRDGVQPVNAWSAALYTTVLDLLFLGYAVPLAAFILWQDDRLPPALLVVAIVVSIACLGIWYALSFHLARLEGLVHRIFSIRFLRRWRSVAKAFLRELAKVMDVMAKGKFLRHVHAHGLSLAMHVSLYSILYVFLVGLGQQPRYEMVISIVALVTAVSHFIPTPGASGYMEATLTFSFSRYLPADTVTAAVVAYRAASFYAAIVLGAIMGGTLLLQSAPADKGQRSAS